MNTKKLTGKLTKYMRCFCMNILIKASFIFPWMLSMEGWPDAQFLGNLNFEKNTGSNEKILNKNVGRQVSDPSKN